MSKESSERLKSLLDEKGISVRQLAKYVGVSDVAVRKWLTKGDVPRDDRLRKVCELLGVTPAFLVFGDETAPKQTIEMEDGTIAVPFLDVAAACGFGAEEQYRLSLLRFVRLDSSMLRASGLNINPGSLNMITATGDSMEPTIQNGSAIIVDTSQTSISSDGLYALAFNHSLFIKRVQCRPSGYLLISDNSKYPPIEVKAFTDQIKIIGRCFIGLQITYFP